MSLLEDARRDVPLLLQRRMTARFLAALPSLDPETFATSYAILAAHRHCKVIGIFTRLSRRDGKHGYLAHIPRVWRLLESHLDHPALAELARWLATYLPPACRRPPAPPATEAAHGD
jgi:aminoglycoside/choline kinase family phosphotransferase